MDVAGVVAVHTHAGASDKCMGTGKQGSLSLLRVVLVAGWG